MKSRQLHYFDGGIICVQLANVDLRPGGGSWYTEDIVRIRTRSFEDGLINTIGSRAYLFCLPVEVVAKARAATRGAEWVACRGGGRGGG
jgi:hypothetical protein